MKRLKSDNLLFKLIHLNNSKITPTPHGIFQNEIYYFNELLKPEMQICQN